MWRLQQLLLLLMLRLAAAGLLLAAGLWGWQLTFSTEHLPRANLRHHIQLQHLQSATRDNIQPQSTASRLRQGISLV